MEERYNCVYQCQQKGNIKITEDKFSTLEEAQNLLGELNECFIAIALVIPNIDKILCDLKGIRKITKIKKRRS